MMFRSKKDDAERRWLPGSWEDHERVANIREADGSQESSGPKIYDAKRMKLKAQIAQRLRSLECIAWSSHGYLNDQKFHWKDSTEKD